MKRKVFRVQFSKKDANNWIVLCGGTQMGVYKHKSSAVFAAREAAKIATPSQVVICGKDGKFQREHTYKDDPVRTKG
jgi:hypothetical protein